MIKTQNDRTDNNDPVFQMVFRLAIVAWDQIFGSLAVFILPQSLNYYIHSLH